MSTIPLILDVDTGVDDAVAILYALANPQFEILGISTVAGNQTLDKTTHNTLAVLEYLGRPEIPVAAGAAAPWMQPLHTAPQVHGENGLGNVELPAPTIRPQPEDAVGCMRRWIESCDRPVTIAAVGPLTNIALLLKSCPNLKSRIERIAIMGGGAFRGNASPVSEFNIYVDPEAARMVFASGVPLLMCGLDVTMKAYATKEDIDAFAAIGNRAGQMCADIFRFYYDFHMSGVRGKLPGCAIHDAVPVMALIHPELFHGEDAYVEVDLDGVYTRGCTAADFRDRGRLADKNTHVILDLDRETFIRQLQDAAARLC
ncbi:MAG TPA: nucleoside hydrolase [Candidatus Pygmaiobacter gallistercoris]|nr:nucleoside hydrolase [Candidatus Pygmaiobacter gallistercoris]